MSIASLQDKLPGFAKDVRLNLSAMAEDDSLTPQQKYGTLVACGYATRNAVVAEALVAEAASRLSPEAMEAAKGAAVMMGMNNVYYRFLHLTSNPEYKTMPARLRMTLIGKPGVDKVDFELWCLAVSAINGCGMCMDSHEKVVREGGLPASAVQNAVRYASIIQSAAIALEAVPA
ncbi:carboxymuconolactone decarboxylase family protein [Oryzibacter oryziterrae]|uniref:carboxymuconolactone decarboxylase family protein n=1 Tax=Oryzibacter oryziterrae TaxID=2766474 RepID=UPI001F4135D3|nr:carboxymuconolactone decarboxylase family protein [Oryzibacter oryziterrae]